MGVGTGEALLQRSTDGYRRVSWYFRRLHRMGTRVSDLAPTIMIRTENIFLHAAGAWAGYYPEHRFGRALMLFWHL